MPASVVSCTICIHDNAQCLKCQMGYLRSYSDEGTVSTPKGCVHFEDMRKHCKFSNSEGI